MENAVIKKCIAKVAKVASMAMAVVALAATAADIGFVVPFDDWRTPIQITGKHVKETFYEPVSVFTTNDNLEVSFGWTCKSGTASLPPVKFSVVDEHGAEVVAWTELTPPAASVSCDNGYWNGHWPCDVLKLFSPGDYMLVAELDPANTLNESAAARADNTTVFRFAIRDEALALAGMMSGFNPLDVTAIKGNDFAQEPHAAFREFIDGVAPASVKPMVQFGPYVPMDGKAISSRKKPLDLVFLVDISGSMGGCIRGLLNNIGIFIEQLMNGDANNDPIDDLRVKIVGFRDYKYSWDRNDLGWYDEGAFSGNLSVLKSKLNSFSARGGGGNGGETSFDALWYVANDKAPNRLLNPTACVSTSSPFRPKGEAARAVILFTDEAPHDPLTANGCAGLTVTDVVRAVEDAEICLTVITTALSGYSGNYGVDRFNKLANTNVYATAAKNSTYIRTGNLSTFANDASALRNLAGQVLSQVDTVVVEPSLVVKSSELGTLSFNWKNDSTAGTNNIFRFSCYNGASRTAPSLTNIVCAATATDGWEHVEMVLGDGDHTFEWNYRKIGYEGDIVDAGLISDLTWEPWATQLKLKPTEFMFECDTDLSGKVEVTCNESWRVLSPNASWIHVSASGNGNGSFTFTVDPNATYDYRTAVIRVRAGEHGNAATDVIVERTVTVTQKPSPYRERGLVEFFDVGIKPRWPWNGLVDVDFRVVAPAKNTPVTLTLVGWDREGEGFGFSDTKYDIACKRYARHSQIVDSANNGCRNVQITSTGTANASFSCPSSGVYRITWDLSEWGSNGYSPDGSINSSVTSALYPNSGNFHTPKFSVILTGSSGTITGVTTSDTVRVDTRQINLCGGLLAAGTEKIGHPTGAIDPIEWDSTVALDGIFDPREIIPDEYRAGVEAKMTNRVCVLNDVYVEGGMITNDVVWKADRVHVVRDNVFIKEGASLTIEDGAVVKLCNATKIFARTLPDTLWNLVVCGAYITDACDRDTGGDTLYSSTATGHKLPSPPQKLFYDQTFPATMSDIYTNGRGIQPLVLYRYNVQTNELGETVTNKYGNAQHTAYPWRTRFYTRNQPYGALPYPVEAGDEFYGWFKYSSDPWVLMETNSRTYERLVSEGAMISEDGVPNVKGNYVEKIYAISDIPDPTRYPENHWPKADGGIATITLETDTFVYDGASHMPSVTEVKVGEAVVPPANYTLTYTDASGNEASTFTDIGVYLVNVTFLHDYTNTPSASYVIQSAEAANATITFSPAYYTYSGAKFQKPTVTVRVNNRTLNASEYSLGWSDGDWTAVGTYRATVELKGNYIGTATADFEIRENPDREVVFYGNAADAEARRVAMENNGYEPRFLYLSGSDVAGNAGVATRGIKKLLKEDVAVRNFVLTNFVCRYVDYVTEGSNKCATAYAPEFTGDPLPFMGGITTSDKCLVWTNGYMSASELLSFLVVAATMPEALLPPLDAGSTDAQARAQIAKISWSDSDVTNKITTMAAYNKFRAWVENLDEAVRDRLVDSQRAYISSVLSEILANPRLLGDSEPVSLSITDFKASTTSAGAYEVTVELKAGSPLAALQLNAAKEAFAGKVRLGTSLANLQPAAASDITAAEPSGNKVKLTIAFPVGGTGFMKMKIE